LIDSQRAAIDEETNHCKAVIFFTGLYVVCFQEYEDQLTAESRFVKDLDRFDMILQAFEYEKAECRPSTDLQEFFTSCEGVEWLLLTRYL